MEGLVSVVIPVYNSEKTIERCLNSVVSQTYDKLELIVVNDGSTDSTGMILSRIAKNDNRFVIIESENKGTFETRNI